MKIKIKKHLNNPIIHIDHSLDKYENVILFPEKLAKTNEMLRKIGLPQTKNHFN